MTKEEKIHWLNVEIQTWENDCQSKHPIKEALYAARKALEREPTTKNDLEVDWESYKDVDGNSLDDLILEVLQNNFDCGNTYGYKVADEIIGLLPSVTPQEPSWIPVTERLPEVEGATRCLVTVDRYGIDDYTAIRRYFPDTKDFNDTVTAWMPLAEPYEGGQEDDKA